MLVKIYPCPRIRLPAVIMKKGVTECCSNRVNILDMSCMEFWQPCIGSENLLPSRFCVISSHPCKTNFVYNFEQESIPAGCVPSAEVSSTPGEGGMVAGTVYQYPPHTIPLHTLAPSPRYPTFSDTLPLWKGHGTRDTLPPVDRQTPVKTLPSRNLVGGR